MFTSQAPSKIRSLIFKKLSTSGKDRKLYFELIIIMVTIVKHKYS